MPRLSRNPLTSLRLLALLTASLTTGVTPTSAHHAAGPTTHTVDFVCGDVIGAPGYTAVSGDVFKLRKDVGPCTAATRWGIKIVANGITLDLNGFDILGCNNPDPSPGKCNAPIVLPSPSDGAYTAGEGPGILLENVEDVTVTNSRATWTVATGTDTPGSLTGTSGLQDVSNVRFFNQGVAATNVGGSCPDILHAPGVYRPDCNNVIEKLRVAKSIGHGTTTAPSGEGIVFDESGGNTIRYNMVDHSGPYAGIAIYDDPSTPCDAGSAGFTAGRCSRGNRIEDNTVTDSNTANGGAIGIRIEPRVNYTLIEDNTVDNSSGHGIMFFATAHHNTVNNNVVTDNGFRGTGGDRTPPTGGPADETGDLRDGDGSGPYEPNAGDGIRVSGGSNDNTITNNVVCGNAGNGIYVLGGAGGNQIHNNEVGGSIAGTANVGDGRCGSRAENLCTTGPSTGGSAPPPPCTKNNVGRYPTAYDIQDGNLNCGTNSWVSNTHGRNRVALYNDSYQPSCAAA